MRYAIYLSLNSGLKHPPTKTLEFLPHPTRTRGTRSLPLSLSGTSAKRLVLRLN